MTTSDEARAKGLNFRTFLNTLERMKGKDVVEATIQAMPEEPQEALRYGKIVASGWYPVAWYRELHGAMQRVCRAGPELSRQLGHDTTVDDFQGVYRVITSMLSPETLVGQAPRLIKMYWEGGSAEKKEARHGMAAVSFRNWNGFDRNIWEDIAGSCEALLELCGAQHVRRRVLSGGNNFSSHFDVEFRWA